MSRNSESTFQVHLSSTKAMFQYMTAAKYQKKFFDNIPLIHGPAFSKNDLKNYTMPIVPLTNFFSGKALFFFQSYIKLNRWHLLAHPTLSLNWFLNDTHIN